MTDNKIMIDAQIEFLDELAEASVGMNPYFQWAKIIVTDDKPNLNKQRVPLEEFSNIIATGLHTPIKMTESSISKGHKEAVGKVIGTVTQLTQDGDKVIALAAFWKKERPDDLAMLKDMYTKGAPPNVSWEIAYAESRIEEEIEDLLGTALTGMTILSNPAYGGRTPFIAMSSVEQQEASNVEELDTLKTELESLKTRISELETEISTRDTELAELREYKQAVEAAAQKESRLLAIKDVFSKAGITKDDEYFNSNQEMLLGLSDTALEFMIQEFVAFSETKSTEANVKDVKVPNLRAVAPEKLTPTQLGKLLRERTLK